MEAVILRHYPSIHLKGLRRTTKNFSQDNRSPGQDLNPGPPEYEAGVYTTRPRRSAYLYFPVQLNPQIIRRAITQTVNRCKGFKKLPGEEHFVVEDCVLCMAPSVRPFPVCNTTAHDTLGCNHGMACLTPADIPRVVYTSEHSTPLVLRSHLRKLLRERLIKTYVR
jgi:hypothetical protein